MGEQRVSAPVSDVARVLAWLERRRHRVLLASVLFAVFTLLAIGPLKPFDLALHRPWADLFTPNRVGLLRDTADKIAGQQVNMTVLLAVTVLAVVRSRCWNPVVYVVAAVVGFYVVGLVKIGFSRDSTALGLGADFFRGHLGHVEKFVMSYPSGHSSEAILIYGTAYAVLRLYVGCGPRTLATARVVWALVVGNCVTVSFYLGHHWLTDLLGGLLLGWILLEVVLHVGARAPRLALGSSRSVPVDATDPGRRPVPRSQRGAAPAMSVPTGAAPSITACL